MAQIEDLPPEILHRILQLGASMSDERGRRGLDFGSTSLVARRWRKPSQDLLVFTCSTKHIFSLSAAHYTVAISGQAVRQLDVSVEDRGRLQLVGQSCSRIQGLSLEMGKSRFTSCFMTHDFLPGLLENLKSLEIMASISGSLTLTETPVLLVSLSVFSTFIPPAPFIDPLLLSATHLTRLDLVWMVRGFPNRLMEPLKKFGPQLRHLALLNALASAPPPNSHLVGVGSFLATCTSLRVLMLSYSKLRGVSAIVSLIPAALVELRTNLQGEGRHGEAADLLEPPGLPAMTRLRR
uniref:F-box domain-containing protein n=1 Tax=Leucosporidium scottii TaxID=5278 RepID=A0A0H5FTL4_9BASI|nr:hypothetical protein [Leucosporidium scottii]